MSNTTPLADATPAAASPVRRATWWYRLDATVMVCCLGALGWALATYLRGETRVTTLFGLAALTALNIGHFVTSRSRRRGQPMPHWNWAWMVLAMLALAASIATVN